MIIALRGLGYHVADLFLVGASYVNTQVGALRASRSLAWWAGEGRTGLSVLVVRRSAQALERETSNVIVGQDTAACIGRPLASRMGLWQLF